MICVYRVGIQSIFWFSGYVFYWTGRLQKIFHWATIVLVIFAHLCLSVSADEPGEANSELSLMIGLVIILIYVVCVFRRQNEPAHNAGLYIVATLILFGECALHSTLWKEMDESAVMDLPPSFLLPCQERKEKAWYYGTWTRNYYGRISDTSDVHVQAHTLQNRFLFDLAKYTKSTFKDEEWNRYVKTIDDNSPTIFGDRTFRTIIGYEEWFVAQKDPVKRKRLETAYFDSQYYKKKHNKTKAFVKAEIIVGKSLGQLENLGKEDTYAARLIQGEHPEQAVRTGPYFHTAFDELHKWWNWKNTEFPLLTYACGMNRAQAGEFYDDIVAEFGPDEDLVCYVSDYSKMDKHHRRCHIEFEFWCLNQIIEMSYDTLDDLMDIVDTEGFMPSGIYYKVLMGKCTGFRNTTGGNTVLNGTAQIHLMMRAFGVSFEELCELPIRMIILGDDVYTITTRPLADKLMHCAALSDIGWELKKEVLPLHKGTFCSATWMPSTIGTILTGLPARIFVRGFGSLKQIQKPHLQKAYCLAVCTGLLAENMHNPLVRPLLERLIVLTSSHAKLTQRQQRYLNKELLKNRSFRWNCSESVIDITPSVYDFIFKRYNITVREIDDWKDYCSKIPHYQCGLDHVIIDKCIDIDIEPIDDYQRLQLGLNSDYKITPIELK
jgi:hypothetical protein